MNFIEYHNLIEQNLPFLKFKTDYLSGGGEFNYEAKQLTSLREAIDSIKDIPYIEDQIKALKKSWLFKTMVDSQKINYTQSNEVEGALFKLAIKLEIFKEIAENSKIFNSSDTILIRIPEIESFDNLQKYANDLKRAIEIPIIDESIGGNVTILSAEEGSIIFYISLGTITAVKLVAGICWAAAVIKKKRSEADIFEQHAKTLELKNDALTTFVEAQKVQLKNILESEAKTIADNQYNHSDPETIERLKLSISTVADLIEKGVSILPVSNEENIQKSFPDYKNLNLIESTIKQLKN